MVERTDLQHTPTNFYLVTTKRYHEQSTKTTDASEPLILISSYNAATNNCTKTGSNATVRNRFAINSGQQSERNPDNRSQVH
eukprot:2368763-Amphidinium_carterae.2